MAPIRRPAHGPEWYIQRDVIKFLDARGWNVEHTHGNLFQTGFPDLYVAHKKWGTRWIDCKQPKRYSFNPRSAAEVARVGSLWHWHLDSHRRHASRV
jgi:hypothetical protein